MQYISESNLSNVYQIVALTNKKFTAKIVPFAMPAAGKIVDFEPSGDVSAFEVCQNGEKVSWQTPINVNLNSNINVDTQYLDAGYQTVLASLNSIANDIANNELTVVNLKPVSVYHFYNVQILNPGPYNSSTHVQSTTMKCNGDASKSFNLSNIASIINAINSLVGRGESGVNYQQFVSEFQQALTASKYSLHFNGNKNYDVKSGLLTIGHTG